MKRISFISFFIFISFIIFSQDYYLNGYIQNLGECPVYLSAFENNDFVIVDSTWSLDGSFHFILNDFNHPGLYCLEFYRKAGNGNPVMDLFRMEFIYSDENIEINASDLLDIYDRGVISGSRENDIYYEFLVRRYHYNRDSVSAAYSALLASLENGVPATEAKDNFIAMQKRWDTWLVTTAEKNPDLYVSRILKANRFPIISNGEGDWESTKYRFFELSPIDDPLLLYHPQYMQRIDDFLLLYYLGTGIDTILPVEAYYEAIDIIMANVSSDPELRSYIVEYLLEKFERFDIEPAQIFVAENYLDEQCESDIVELVLSRMDGYKSMQPGNIAPGFVIKDRDNKTYRLNRMDNPYILVMFWASTCDHCQEMIPKLHEWYLNENSVDMEFVTISIDTTQYQWEDFINLQQLEWISAFDPLGWNGKVPKAYNVYATPSLFILDSDRRILSKPFTYREFLREIKKL